MNICASGFYKFGEFCFFNSCVSGFYKQMHISLRQTCSVAWLEMYSAVGTTFSSIWLVDPDIHSLTFACEGLVLELHSLRILLPSALRTRQESRIISSPQSKIIALVRNKSFCIHTPDHAHICVTIHFAYNSTSFCIHKTMFGTSNIERRLEGPAS